MIKRISSSILAGICIVMFSGIGAASATVLPPNQQGNSITVTHNDGHTTVDVVTNGKTIVYMDPPIVGP